ncbi:class I SAM-dependent methyltransferase [Patescibacteria group bacterium]|nr:class I SAM-dependent methyltransferase [Patescibacteria group bacterium]
MKKNIKVKKWYNDFFDDYYLRSYKDIVSEERTLQEVGFIEKSLKLSQKSRILDLCCGHGRHLIELAKRGYIMTGQDLARNFLKIATETAKKNDVKVKFICGDMRHIPFHGEFDAIFNIFTSFGYLENDEEDFKVIKQVANSLKIGGKFLLDIRNRDWILANFQYKDWRIIDDLVILEERHLDSSFKKVITKVTYIEKGKIGKITEHSARLYALSNIQSMFKKAGLSIQKVYGGLDFKRHTIKSQRTIIIASKR